MKKETRDQLLGATIAVALLLCSCNKNPIIVLESPPFYFAYAPDMLPVAAPTINMSAQVVNDIPTVNLLPSPLVYDIDNPAFLVYESVGVESNRGTFVRVTSENEFIVIPTLRIAQKEATALILHQSNIRYLGTKSPSKRIDVGGEQIDVWDIDITICTLSSCTMDDILRVFNEYLEKEWGKEPKKDSFGSTYQDCAYQPSQVSVTQNSVGDVYEVNVAPHIPMLKQSIYVPSETTFSSMDNCNDSERQALADQTIDHESIHALMGLEWQEGKYGSNNVPGMIIDVKTPQGPERAKRVAYNEWCRRNVDPILDQLSDTFHNSEHGKINYSNISCACALSQPERDPKEPEINCKGASVSSPTPAPSCGMTYCPCNDPSHGKPRNYSTEVECAVQCPSGLACFSTACIVPPDCGK